jgi:hypothetical protein
MDEKYLSELWNWTNSQDPTFKDRYTFDSWSKKLKSNEDYKKQFYGWVSGIDETFEERRPYNAWSEMVSTDKKKEESALFSREGGTLSATPGTEPQKPSAFSQFQKEDSQYKPFASFAPAESKAKTPAVVKAESDKALDQAKRGVSKEVYVSPSDLKFSPGVTYTPDGRKLEDKYAAAEYKAEELQNKYGDFGFTFQRKEGVVFGEKIVAQADDGSAIEIDLNADNGEEAKKLQSFLFSRSGGEKKRDFTPEEMLVYSDRNAYQNISKPKYDRLYSDENVKKSLEFFNKKINSELDGLEQDKKLLEAEDARINALGDMATQEDVDKFNNMLEVQKMKFKSVQDEAILIDRSIKNVVAERVERERKKGTLRGAIYNGLVIGVENLTKGAVDVLFEGTDLLTRPLLPMDKEKKRKYTEYMKDWMTSSFDQLKARGVTDAFIEDQNMLFRGLIAVPEFLPTLFVPGGPIGRIAAMATQGIGRRMEEYDNSPEMQSMMSREEAFLLNAGKSIIEAKLENVGITQALAGKGLANSLLVKALQKWSPNMGAKALNGILNMEVKSLAAKAALNTAGAFIAEAETGALQNIMETSINELYNVAKEKEVFKQPKVFTQEWMEGVAEDAIMEGIGGMWMGGAANIAKYTAEGVLGAKLSNEEFAIVKKMLSDGFTLEALMVDLKSKVINGEVSAKEMKRTLANFSKAASIVGQMPEGDLSDGQQRVAFDLLNERMKLEAEIKGKDPNLVSKKTKRISEINERLKLISENAVQEQTTSEVAAEEEIDIFKLGDTEYELGDDGKWYNAETLEEIDEETSSKVKAEAKPSKKIPKRGSKGTIAGVKVTYPTMQEARERRAARNEAKYVEDSSENLEEENTDVLAEDLQGEFGILTAENPMAQPLTEEENRQLNEKAEEWLKEKGYKPRRVTGKYGQAENSFFVKGLTKEDAIAFAKKFNQDSVAHSEGLLYQDGAMNKRVKSEDNFTFEDFTPESNFVSVIKTKDGLKTFEIGYDTTTKTAPETTTETGQQQTLAAEQGTPTTIEGTGLRENIKKSIAKVFKSVAVKSFKNAKEMAAYAKAKFNKEIGDRDSARVFVSSDGKVEILVNEELADDTALGHEVWHALLLKVFGDNQAKFAAFRDAIDKTLRQNGYEDIAENLKKFASRYKKDEVPAEEYLAQLGGMMTSAKIDLKNLDKAQRTLLEQIKDIINDFAIQLTGQPVFLKDATPETILDFMSTMSDMMAKGEDISGFFEGGDKTKGTKTRAQIDPRLSELGVEVDKKEKLPQKITPANESKVLAQVDNLLNTYPKALTDNNQWKELMSRVFSYKGPNGEVMIPKFPTGLSRMSSSVSEVLKELSKVSEKQRDLASSGLKGTKEIGKLYKEGKMDETDTGLYFLWNIMSIGISPYPQEAGFLRAVNNGIDSFIKKSADGKFLTGKEIDYNGDKIDSGLAEYFKWVDETLPKGVAGSSSKPNLRSFGSAFLSKASTKIESGEFAGLTKMQALHEILSDKTTPTNELRRKWLANLSGMSFNNKIFDFILLTTGRSDLFVIDRVRTEHFWDSDNLKKESGLKPATSIYDGSELIFGNTKGAGYSKMLSDVSGMVFAELANRTMQPVVQEAYRKIGVTNSPDVGRFHWETWVAASSQEVSHGSIDAIVQRKKSGEITDAGIRQGKYGAWDFNFAYKKRSGKDFVYEFIDEEGNTYVFDDISEIYEEISNQNTKKSYKDNSERFILKDEKGNIIKRKTEKIDNAWYDQYGVNKQKYFEYLKDKAKEFIPAPNVVEDQGVVIKKEPEVKTRAQKTLPDNVAKRLTEDGNGNYVFHHYSRQQRDKILPSTGSGSLFTSREEQAALSSIGGMAMYYAQNGQKEAGVGNELHTIVVPKDKIYYMNEDVLDFFSQGKEEFLKYMNRGRPREKWTQFAFEPNYQVAFITKIAIENGFEMVVNKWRNDVDFRAQTTLTLKPEKENIPFKKSDSKIDVGDKVFVFDQEGLITEINENGIARYTAKSRGGRINIKESQQFRPGEITLLEKGPFDFNQETGEFTTRAQKAQPTEATENDFVLPFGKYKGQWYSTTPKNYKEFLLKQDWFDPRKYFAKPDTETRAQKAQPQTIPGYDRMIGEVQKIVEKSKKRGVSAAQIVENVINYIQKSRVYERADDLQREQIIRDARKDLGLRQKSAPRVDRVLGIKDSVSTEDKKNLMEVIKAQVKATKNLVKAQKEIAKQINKEIRELKEKGKITTSQMIAALRRLSEVDLLNEESVSNFLDYIARVFKDAAYYERVTNINRKRRAARNSASTKIGIADGLTPLLQKIFSIDARTIPEKALDAYEELVNMFADRSRVLQLSDIENVTKMAQKVFEAVEGEVERARSLAEVLSNYENMATDENGNIEFSKTVDQMVNDGSISAEDGELMKKYKSMILEEAGLKKEKDVRSEEEIEEERQQLVETVRNYTPVFFQLPTQDERNVAREIFRLIKTGAIDKMSNKDLKDLLRIIDNIERGFLPHSAQIMKERMNQINNGETLSEAVNNAKMLPAESRYAKIKALFGGSAIRKAIDRNPLFFIDELFGNFKSTPIFDSIFKPISRAFSSYQSEVNTINRKIQNAMDELSNSLGKNPNKVQFAKQKIMAYMLESEYQANPNSKEVRSAKDFLDATIKYAEETEQNSYSDKDIENLKKIRDEFFSGEAIDLGAMLESFSPAEKKAIKTISDINNELATKVAFTSAIIRGRKVGALNNYIHHNTLGERSAADIATEVSMADVFNASMKPSTKAKSLIERTGAATPLVFDPFSSTTRGARQLLMDYHLTEPIRTARRTVKYAESKVTGKQKRILNAISGALEQALSNTLINTYHETTFVEDAIRYMEQTGYRAMLGSIPRAVAELTSNLSYVMLYDPASFKSGISKYRSVAMSEAGLSVMKNVKSQQTERLYPASKLSGRGLDKEVMSQASGIKAGKSQNDVMNAMTVIYNYSGKQVKNVAEATADALIGSPDKAIMKPLWFGAFASEFKKATGQDVDYDKIANNNEAYLTEFSEAIDQAAQHADETSVRVGASDNPFTGILKGANAANQSAMKQAFNKFNNFMSRFLIYEYTTARTGVYALMGSGKLTQKQGAAILGATMSRMIVYSLLSKELVSIMMGMLGFGDDEEDEKTFFQKLGQATGSALSGLILGRNFGNFTKAPINIGVEKVNEKFLDFLREGDYDPYEDAIQYTIIPKDERKKGDIMEYVKSFSGAFSPMIGTMQRTLEVAARDPKTQAAQERRLRELSTRTPLEILGNTGYIPLYRDVRKIVMESLYEDMRKEKKGSGSGGIKTSIDTKIK